MKSVQSWLNSSSQKLILLSVGQCWAIFSQNCPLFFSNHLRLVPSSQAAGKSPSSKRPRFLPVVDSVEALNHVDCWSIWNKGPEKPWMPHSTNSNWDRVPGFSSAHCLWFLSRFIGFYYRQEKTILTRSSSMLWISVDPAKLNRVKIQYQCSPFIWSAAILSKLGTCLRLYARVG